MQTALSTSAVRHTWVGGMHPPQGCLRALKGSQAHEGGGPLPHGLCQGLQVASHEGEKALQVMLQPAGQSMVPLTVEQHHGGRASGSETGGALDRTSWPTLQPAAHASTHALCAKQSLLPERLMQHEAKGANSAEAAVRALKLAASAVTPARPAPWHCVWCWCPHRAGAAMHGLKPTDKTPLPPWPSLIGQPCRMRAPQRAAVTASHSSLHSR